MLGMVSVKTAPSYTSMRVGLGRVLVVEDEELIRETVALALAEEGFEVIIAADGPAALEKLVGSADGTKSPLGDIALVVLDLMLPGMNGLDLCRLARHQGLDVPILMLSAKGTETDRVVGLEVGADDYLALWHARIDCPLSGFGAPFAIESSARRWCCSEI
jgi:two-component system, OmpR family, phosphate regulon response regulator PhoB